MLNQELYFMYFIIGQGDRSERRTGERKGRGKINHRTKTDWVGHFIKQNSASVTMKPF